MKKYDNSVAMKIGQELKTHYRAQRTLAQMPFLLDILFLASRNQTLNKLIRKQL